MKLLLETLKLAQLNNFLTNGEWHKIVEIETSVQSGEKQMISYQFKIKKQEKIL